jgi:DNA-directed RNA polymerase subunit RPC12/RpoP
MKSFKKIIRIDCAMCEKEFLIEESELDKFGNICPDCWEEMKESLGQ